MIHDEVLIFHDSILYYHELFHDKAKTHGNINGFVSQYLNHMKFISHEYANDHYL